MLLIFKDKATADTLLKEIACTPFDAVIVWAGNPNPDFAFDADANLISYISSTDGRQAIAHPFSESDAAWLEAYLDVEIIAGDVAITVELPGDWKWPEPVSS